MSKVLPSGSGLAALLAIAAMAAVLSNVVNNLPATLVLLPLVAPGGPVAVLAVLIGVNIGPNLTYVGSLSNLLWRRVLRRHDVDAGVGEYTRLGVCTVPISLAVAVVALWASVRLLAFSGDRERGEAGRSGSRTIRTRRKHPPPAVPR